MAEPDRVLFVQNAIALTGDVIAAVIDQQLKTAPKGAALQFIIRPLAPGEEFSRVIDRMARTEADNDCHGKCD